MPNMKQAPTLKFNGDKKVSKDFYKLPYNIITPLFNELSGKEGNLLKLMIVLLGTQQGFKITQNWVLERTGMSKDAYYRARKKLEELGYITYNEEKNTITVNIDYIKKKN